MKKASKGAAAKGRAKPKSVDEYLAAVPEPARSTLNKVRAAIGSVVPAETTEVISYGIPAFRYKRMMMWYAAFSDHCSMFPTASVIAKLRDELKSYRSKPVSTGPIVPFPDRLGPTIIMIFCSDVPPARR